MFFSLQNFWKLSIILLLLESYSNWSLLNRHSWENHLNDTIVVSLESNIYLDDLKFYALVLRVFLNTLCYVLLIQAFTRIYTLFNNQCTIPLLLVWKTITISNCSLFLTLPAFIWDINVYDVHSHFIYIYSTLSQLLFYRGKYYITFFTTLLNFYNFSSFQFRQNMEYFCNFNINNYEENNFSWNLSISNL